MIRDGKLKEGHSMEEKKKRHVKRTPAKRASEAAYKKKNMRQINISFYPPDHDLYEFVKAHETEELSAPAYIKRLIRENMEGE